MKWLALRKAYVQLWITDDDNDKCGGTIQNTQTLNNSLHQPPTVLIATLSRCSHARTTRDLLFYLPVHDATARKLVSGQACFCTGLYRSAGEGNHPAKNNNEN